MASGHAVGAYVLRLVTSSRQEAFPLAAKAEFTLGRGSSADVEVHLADLSRRHACFRLEPSFAVCDLGSTNGTFVRGAKLTPHEFVPVEVGEPIVVGHTIALLLASTRAHLVHPVVGSDPWLAQLEKAFRELRDQGLPFAICDVDLSAPVDGLMGLVGLSADGDTAAFLSETHLALRLAGCSHDSSRSLKPAIDKYLTTIGARARVTVTHCPTDVNSIDEFLRSKPGGGVSRAPTIRPLQAVVRGERMTQLYDLVREVAPTVTSMVVLGETGAGKEVVAQAIHGLSDRRDAPFVALNCAALPETLLESELFGYERGAFTGAVGSKEGLLESAHGGTVFLDEIGEMPLATQAKLLRVLQERTVLRVGALKPKPIDFRLISATNRNLEREIAQGRFRADLYYRINGFSIVIPPLRERTDEIEPLAMLFAASAAKALGRRVPLISPDATRTLLQYSWPGNVRELKAAIERAVLVCRAGPVLPEHLPEELLRTRAPKSGPSPTPPQGFPSDEDTRAGKIPVMPGADPGHHEPRMFTLSEELERLERERILGALSECGGNQTRAAKLLGITRRVLIGRLERYNVPRPRGGKR